jgi:hypothetical protein
MTEIAKTACLCYGLGALATGLIYLALLARSVVGGRCIGGPFAVLHYGSRLLLMASLWPLYALAFVTISIKDRSKKNPKHTDNRA